MILRFLGFSGRGISPDLHCWTQNCLKFKMAPRDYFVPCCTWTTAYRWIRPHSLMKKLGLNWLELLVGHSASCIQLVDLLKLQAPNCANGMSKKSEMSSWIHRLQIHNMATMAPKRGFSVATPLLRAGCVCFQVLGQLVPGWITITLGLHLHFLFFNQSWVIEKQQSKIIFDFQRKLQFGRHVLNLALSWTFDLLRIVYRTVLFTECILLHLGFCAW